MLNGLKKFFSGRPAPVEREEADTPLAVAALLVEAARADEAYDDAERSLIEKALSKQFDLDAEKAAALRVKGEAAQAEAVDLHRFTKIAKQMPSGDKIALVESLWRIVLSDQERDPHEDALIRRVCGLIYISDPESGAARRRVEQELAQE